MFFKKSKKTEDDAVVKRGIKKMDAVITGAVLGGVVASLYGVKKLRDANEKNEANEKNQNPEKTAEKPAKKGFFARLFNRKK
jgi:hypothetical protein